jgi:NADPH:quinone reductase
VADVKSTTRAVAASSHELGLDQTRILKTVAVDEGKLPVMLDRAYPLAGAREAPRAPEAGEITGRVALEMPQ